MPCDYMRKNFLNWFDLWLQFCEQTVPESTGDTEVAKIIHKKGDFHDCKMIGTHLGLLCKEGIWWESRSQSPWVPSFIWHTPRRNVFSQKFPFGQGRGNEGKRSHNRRCIQNHSIIIALICEPLVLDVFSKHLCLIYKDRLHCEKWSVDNRVHLELEFKFIVMKKGIPFPNRIVKLIQ